MRHQFTGMFTRRLVFRSVRWVTEFGAGGGADLRLSNIHYENFMPAQTATKSVQIPVQRLAVVQRSVASAGDSGLKIVI